MVTFEVVLHAGRATDRAQALGALEVRALRLVARGADGVARRALVEAGRGGERGLAAAAAEAVVVDGLAFDDQARTRDGRGALDAQSRRVGAAAAAGRRAGGVGGGLRGFVAQLADGQQRRV